MNNYLQSLDCVFSQALNNEDLNLHEASTFTEDDLFSPEALHDFEDFDPIDPDIIMGQLEDAIQQLLEGNCILLSIFER